MDKRSKRAGRAARDPHTSIRQEAAALAADGACYARALLDRIEAGTAAPGELPTLLDFLGGGPMRDGACAAIFAALAHAAARQACRAPATGAEGSHDGR